MLRTTLATHGKNKAQPEKNVGYGRNQILLFNKYHYIDYLYARMKQKLTVLGTFDYNESKLKTLRICYF